MNMRSCIAAALALVLTACSTTPSEPDGDFAEAELSAVSERVLFHAIGEAVRTAGFPVGSGVNMDALELETGWQSFLKPFRSTKAERGYRLQALVRADPVPDVEDAFMVSVRVRKQINESLVRPGDLRYAEWEGVEDDLLEARIVLGHIRANLMQGMEVGEEERAKLFGN